MSELQGFIASQTPLGWETRPLWSLFRRRKVTGYADEELLSVYRDYGVIPKSSRDDNHNKESDDLSGYQLVTQGSLVTNKMKAWQGSIAISRYRGIVSPAYYVYEPLSEEWDQFLHYLLRSAPYIALYGRISKGVRVNQWDLEHDALRNVPVMLPDLDTQKAIAYFLDRETTRIDQLIEKKQRLIELINEKRAVETDRLIFGLVDEGLVPTSKVKFLAKKISKGTTPSTLGAETVAEGVRYLRAENIWFGIVTDSPQHFISDETHRMMDRSALKPNDVLVVIAGATTGKAAVIRKDQVPANTNQAISYIRLWKPYLAPVISAAIQTKRVQQEILLKSVQSAQPNLAMEDLGNLKVPAPRREEALAIIEKLEQADLKYRALTKAISKSVSELQEFRSALITAAVTGQIDVTTWGKQGQTDHRLDRIEEAMRA